MVVFKKWNTLGALLCCLLVVLSSCEMAWSPKSPKGYVMPKPQKIILEKKVNEISGLFYMPEEKAFLTIADNKKKIFRLTPEGEVSDYFEEELPEQLDYEDVLKVDDVVYALVSDGTIISLKKSDSGLLVQKYPFWSKDKNDFETLYYDSSAGGLIMLCKQCASEKGENVRTSYRFNLSNMQFDTAPYYTISTKSVRDALKDGKVDFNPSSAVIHPRDKKLYMLSSAGNLLVVSDVRGKVEAVYRLNPTLYPQAEGIAFAGNGDMYITNEAKLGKPTLLKLIYKPTER